MKNPKNTVFYIIQNHKLTFGLLGLVLAFVVLLIPTFTRNNDFTVNFIDVGQGDSILIGCHGHFALADGGGSPYDAVSVGEYTVLPYLRNYGISSLDYCFGTHPDADHMGGLLAVADQMKVDNLVVYENYPDNTLFGKLKALAKAKNINIEYAAKGDVFRLGSNTDFAEIRVLSPKDGESFGEGETNEGSLVLLVSYKDFDVLLTGDIEGEKQTELLNCGIDFTQTEVLQIPHHGSSNSYNEAWYNAFEPQAVIISVGKDNGYGHPYAPIISYWQNRGVCVYRTDIDGSVKITAEGSIGIYETYAENN